MIWSVKLRVERISKYSSHCPCCPTVINCSETYNATFQVFRRLRVTWSRLPRQLLVSWWNRCRRHVTYVYTDLDRRMYCSVHNVSFIYECSPLLLMENWLTHGIKVLLGNVWAISVGDMGRCRYHVVPVRVSDGRSRSHSARKHGVREWEAVERSAAGPKNIRPRKRKSIFKLKHIGHFCL